MRSYNQMHNSTKQALMEELRDSYGEDCLEAHDVLLDGGPEAYKKFANTYEEYSAGVNWRGPESTVSTWCKYYYDSIPYNGSPKHKLFDAGCGTGLVGEKILELRPDAASMVEVHGGDLSPDMLKLAQAKNMSIYADLRIVNLKEPLPYEKGSFDSVISAGTFLQGHCGPECLANVMEVLKEGGYFIITVRYSFYNKTRSEWEQQVQECNCELVEEVLAPYSDVATGVVVVFRKKLTS